ncbi:oxidoreductase domain-containing protein [Lentithecium fluviatile CBS 122367]|uniref:D-xylose 1-dehydrogenase (NADP(+), D-xylono-1,5-lactone-forming) n=1 Tax=Lentithecium fluviatile CBS 122367 TaxID=1168545 RepID=A0A6G1JN78_9PLEO|nr:oxidoreductase domain-containing protein [Lentithecium fluviatile CBS 122367]
MAFLYNYFRRTYTTFFPPVATKNDGALRIGILGAANIAPQGIITPAKSHPEVIVAAVAARDPKKAEAFAKKHGIPIVHKTYDDLIADPSINCIYNPLPNGLHYEWTIKALKAGKHVLLEKPSVSNAEEARSLFRHPLFQGPNALVLLEAFHYRFHPLWQTFLTLFDAKDVEEVEVKNSLLAGVFPRDDIRFIYSLSGGTLMDFGAYAVSSVRGIFASEPANIKSASHRPMPAGFDQKCDEAIFAVYEFPNGGVAKISVDLQATGGYWFPALTKNWPRLKGSLPTLTVKLRATTDKSSDGSEKSTQKRFIVHNYMGPHIFHRIDIATTIQHKDLQGKVAKTENKIEYMKVYNWPTVQEGRKGEEWWSTYRFQLEAFVNRVKGRTGSGVWVEPDDSIQQMEMIDATYRKTGLPVRPTSKALGSVT